jgi:hypothetical protein
MEQKLFAVYPGGRAAKCNTELHDVVVVVGSSIESTYHQLMDKWFGNPLRLHIDSWMELRIVDGQRIVLRSAPAQQATKLFSIDLGAYLPGQFTELHAKAFVVAENEKQVKLRAKGELLRGTQSVHTDDLFDIDDCLEITEVDGHHIHLEPTAQTQPFEPNNGYHYPGSGRRGLCRQPQAHPRLKASKKLVPERRPQDQQADDHRSHRRDQHHCG